MFCPNCGANNSTEQKFCRSCGLNLEKTAETLLEQIPSAESAKLLKRERNLEKFGNVVFTGFGVVLVTAVGAMIYLIITKVILSGNSVFGGILLVAFLVFAILMLAYVVFKEDLKEKKQKANPTLQNELSEKRETGKLLEEKPFEPVPSITENTTDLLYAESKTRKLE
jgi:zinc-ribbon domain